jgi:N-sulfoglucosamine sulfohydrolase
VFEAEPYAHPAQRNFYERYMKGEKVKAGRVNDTDFEPAPRD